MRSSALIATLALCGCSAGLMNYRGYSGDGKFVAHAAPSWTCQDGYTIDLGAVDLSTSGESTHRLEGLPPIEATLGIALGVQKNMAGRMADVPRPAAAIELSLRDDSGRVVLSRHERLSEWTRSFALGDAAHAYLYQRGTQIEVAVAPGSVRVERFPIGVDDSWGTYFTPRRGTRYTLHFTVEEPDAALAGVDARLQVNSVAGCL